MTAATEFDRVGECLVGIVPLAEPADGGAGFRPVALRQSLQRHRAADHGADRRHEPRHDTHAKAHGQAGRGAVDEAATYRFGGELGAAE